MRCLQSLAVVWATLAGVSVTLQLGGTIVLNGKSVPSKAETHMLHALYVSQGSILIGFVWLGVLAMLVPGDPPKRPQKLWFTFGGVVTLPSFVTTPAAQVLGLQLVLMLLLLGMVAAAIAFDCHSHRLHLGILQGAGLVLLCVGVALELLDAVPLIDGSPSEVILYSSGCLLVGVLYALQSKMNRRLARDLGSSLRSATWSNASAFVAGMVLILLVRYVFFVGYEVKMSQWWVWLLVGLQSAYYTVSLTVLPKILGYSTMFVLVLGGKLASSALADTIGLFQPAVPLSVLRCASVSVMLIGAVPYTLGTATKAPSVVTENDCESYITTDSVVEGRGRRDSEHFNSILQ